MITILQYIFKKSEDAKIRKIAMLAMSNNISFYEALTKYDLICEGDTEINEINDIKNFTRS